MVRLASALFVCHLFVSFSIGAVNDPVLILKEGNKVDLSLVVNCTANWTGLNWKYEEDMEASENTSDLFTCEDPKTKVRLITMESLIFSIVPSTIFVGESFEMNCLVSFWPPPGEDADSVLTLSDESGKEFRKVQVLAKRGEEAARQELELSSSDAGWGEKRFSCTWTVDLIDSSGARHRGVASATSPFLIYSRFDGTGDGWLGGKREGWMDGWMDERRRERRASDEDGHDLEDGRKESTGRRASGKERTDLRSHFQLHLHFRLLFRSIYFLLFQEVVTIPKPSRELVGINATIQCLTEGYPPPAITWKCSLEPLADSDDADGKNETSEGVTPVLMQGWRATGRSLMVTKANNLYCRCKAWQKLGNDAAIKFWKGRIEVSGAIIETTSTRLVPKTTEDDWITTTPVVVEKKNATSRGGQKGALDEYSSTGTRGQQPWRHLLAAAMMMTMTILLTTTARTCCSVSPFAV